MKSLMRKLRVDFAASPLDLHLAQIAEHPPEPVLPPDFIAPCFGNCHVGNNALTHYSLSRGDFQLGINRDSGTVYGYRDPDLPPKNKAKKDGLVEGRLREFVRARVHKDGHLYQYGAGVKLAEAIGKQPSWVSHYVDPDPDPTSRRNADIDEALAICAYYGVTLADFAAGLPTPAAAAPAVAPRFARALSLLERMSDAGLRRAFDVLVGLQRAYPLERDRRHRARAVDKTGGKVRK